MNRKQRRKAKQSPKDICTDVIKMMVAVNSGNTTDTEGYNNAIFVCAKKLSVLYGIHHTGTLQLIADEETSLCETLKKGSLARKDIERHTKSLLNRIQQSKIPQKVPKTT